VTSSLTPFKEHTSHPADELEDAASQTPATKVNRQASTQKRPAELDEYQQDGHDRQEDDSVASRLQMRHVSQRGTSRRNDESIPPTIWTLMLVQLGKRARLQIKSEAEKLAKPKRKVAAAPRAPSSKGSKASRSKVCPC
jgi:hypothetical protein